MGSENLADAVGAGEEIEVNGKTYKLSPLDMQQLQELQRKAVRSYKRQYLLAYKENLDLLGNGDGESLLLDKIDEVAKWDMEDLPKRTVYDVSKLKVNDKLRKLLKDKFGDVPTERNKQLLVLATALDSDDVPEVTPDAVKELTGTAPMRVTSPYDTWWVTGTYDGMVALIWSAVSRNHPELTEEEFTRWPFVKIAEAARVAETITTPDLGNI